MEIKKIKVAITHGDINGVSYEVILKTLKDEAILDLFTPVLYASTKILNYWKQKLSIDFPSFNIIKSPKDAKDGQINIINIGDENIAKVEIGLVSENAGRLAFEALNLATKDIMNGLVDVLVTAPINKSAMPKDIFPYKGHTDYLNEVCNKSLSNNLMVLCAENKLRVALVTDHIAISEVPTAINKDIIIEKIKSFEETLIKDFGIVKPRIAVLGLNPHCGDNGLMGKEEEEIISPAIKEAWENSYLAFGPYSADGFFANEISNKFDGVLSMYHDQALAPFKALYMDEGVNFTAGLDIIRTSPDHGTAFDIAGKGIASEKSFRNAIYLAIDNFRNRQRHYIANRNPLKRAYVSGKEDNLPITDTNND